MIKNYNDHVPPLREGNPLWAADAFNNTKNGCTEEANGYGCTRDRDHPMPHAAGGNSVYQPVYATWETEE